MVAAIAGCGSSGGNAPVTLTETVTVSSAADAGGTGAAGGSSVSDTSGAPITVVNPSAADAGGSSGAETTGTDTASSSGPASETGEQPSATGSEGTQDIDDPFQTGSTAAATTTTSVPDSPETRAAARMVKAQCPTVLSASDIGRALGTSLAAQTIRVEDVANPDNKMTARTKCYYGTADIGAARPLVVAIASFSDVDAAEQQRNVTLASEKAAGAKVSNADIGSGDGEIKIMLRQGGLAVTQVGAATVSVAIDHGVVADSALRSALTVLTRSVIKHVQ
jgi:hypothetical protein